ncbi:D site-binding protein-like isoform X3 [Ostrea edulis]|uniref:D site-binding protein-like isoform X3 n=1 Tax=Ostrea edulis TaxID=37623 RepID=UPI0024AF7D80|nr:D site-binding protein-like isoform X3 [Ostrea edulis]
MASYGNTQCFDSGKLGRDSPSSYQQFFCDPNKPTESRLHKMNLEGGYGKLSMDPNFSDAYMMDGLGGGGYMPSGGIPQGPCSTSGPSMVGGPSMSHGYMGQNTGLHTNNYQSGPMSSSYLNPYMQFQGLAAAASASSPTLARALAAVQQTQKRPRSEKKPIPSEQKDNKYFERRKRNNMAAKKSRDARKAREDEIAIRASFLEKENAILRAQVGTLREEANSLKQLLLQKRSRP